MNDKEKAKAFRDLRAEQAKRRVLIVTDTRTEILRLLAQAEERVRLRLASQPGDAERWVLTDLQAEIRRTLTEFGDQAAARLSSTAGGAWSAGQDLIEEPLVPVGFRLAGVVPMLDTRQLVAMRAFMTDRIKDVGVQAVNKINTELGLVVLGAQPPAAAITRVADILGDGARARAINITRTELLRVYDTASQGRLIQAAGVVPDLGKQWRRSGKVHSRITHDLADGQVQPADKPYKLGNGVTLMYPHDPAAPAAETINCGCVSLPWKKDWEMATPGRRRYTEQEMQANPTKRDIQEQIDSGKSINELLAGGKAA